MSFKNFFTICGHFRVIMLQKMLLTEWLLHIESKYNLDFCLDKLIITQNVLFLVYLYDVKDGIFDCVIFTAHILFICPAYV